MLSSPIKEHTNQEEELDAVFHALCDRTRRALIGRLAQGPAVVTELAAPFDMTLGAVSKHLRVLEGAKLIRREVDGKFHRCSLSAKPMLEADRWLNDYRAFWEDNLGALANYVKTMEGQPKP
jgi:DNA-binding transcriptional ArsR family regulator